MWDALFFVWVIPAIPTLIIMWFGLSIEQRDRESVYVGTEELGLTLFAVFMSYFGLILMVVVFFKMLNDERLLNFKISFPNIVHKKEKKDGS